MASSADNQTLLSMRVLRCPGCLRAHEDHGFAKPSRLCDGPLVTQSQNVDRDLSDDVGDHVTKPLIFQVSQKTEFPLAEDDEARSWLYMAPPSMDNPDDTMEALEACLEHMELEKRRLRDQHQIQSLKEQLNRRRRLLTIYATILSLNSLNHQINVMFAVKSLQILMITASSPQSKTRHH